MGAWIETFIALTNHLRVASRPTWARGLKHSRSIRVADVNTVAPHVGAWIETSTAVSNETAKKSRPTWARGLKLFIYINLFVRYRRAPRGRVD